MKKLSLVYIVARDIARFENSKGEVEHWEQMGPVVRENYAAIANVSIRAISKWHAKEQAAAFKRFNRKS